MAETLRRRGSSGQDGFTMLEVIVVLVILSTCAIPLLISLADAPRQATRSYQKRVMKQLLEYKYAHVLLDRPAEGEEPIYVDGAEGNFGEDFANDPDKAFWFSEALYSYAWRIDSEELDLGQAGGITGDEESFAEDEVVREDEGDAGGNPFAGGGESAEEELGQIRYRVTLTVFYRPGDASFDQAMSLVTYVRHPQNSEAMTGPEMGSGGDGGIGGGEARAGGVDGTSTTTSSTGITSVTSGSRNGGR